MQTSVIAGFLLILLAAAMNGAYAIPMKFMPRWKWENIWLVWTILSLWLFPVLLAWATVPRPIEAYSQTPESSLIKMGFMGLLWGAGVLLLGMSFPLVGVAVGAAVGLGCAAAMGTLLPILYLGLSSIPPDTAKLVLIGVMIVVIGVAVCGYAGRARERQQGTGTLIKGSSARGVLYAGVGGTLTAALNLALTAGSSIAASVAQQHPSTSAASIAVWIPVLFAGGIPGVIYTLMLVARDRSSGAFRIKGTAWYWPLIMLMGVLWLGSIVVYGNGVLMIGRLGGVVGWPVFMSGAVIASALWGTLFGEWRNAGKTAAVAMAGGVACLMVAITILGKAGH